MNDNERTQLAEKIRELMGDNPKWLPSEEGEASIVVIEHERPLPCGCNSWRKNEPHPGFPLREHYGPATIGPEQFTICVFKDNGIATHFRCGEIVTTITL